MVWVLCSLPMSHLLIFGSFWKSYYIFLFPLLHYPPPSPFSPCVFVMVRLIRLVCMPPTISDHLQLCLPTLWCHSDAHCVTSHNPPPSVTALHSLQSLISLTLFPT